MFDKLTDKSSEIECLFIERMKQLLKIGGYAAIILPSSVLTNTGIYTLTREIILKYFKIVAITEFGSNTFMATNTNTVTLFLKRRPNSDHKNIENAVKEFFEKPKDVTVLGIEKAFSKYVSNTFDGIVFEDYISFINKKPNDSFKKQEIYEDYLIWFEKQNEIKKLKESKTFKIKSVAEQEKEIQALFYEKVLEIEREKIMYFLLSYNQETLITKTGEKQEEKEFLGYEFSKSRGREGIKMLANEGKLYDELDQYNPEKANYYVYRAFLYEQNEISDALVNNISTVKTTSLIDFSVIQFEKTIDIGAKQPPIESKWNKEKLGKYIIPKSGTTFPKDYQGNKDDSKIPFLKVSDMNTESNWKFTNDANNYVDDKTATNILSATIFKKGSIVFPKVGMAIHTNKKRILAKDSCVDNNIMCIDSLDKSVLDNEYLYELFKFFIQLRNFASSANPPSILTDKLMDFKVPVPPMDIQKRIVRDISDVEKKEYDVIKKTIACKTSLKNSDWFSYELERIEKLSKMVQRGKSANYGTSNIQIIKSGQARGYNTFDFSKRYYVSESFVSDERNLQKGDILINSTGVGTAGRVTLFDLDGEFVVDSHITIVRLNQDMVVPKYVLYALANIGFKTIEAMATGQSGQIELGLPTVNAIKIPVPPIEKQREIVAEIEKIESEMQTLENEIANAETQKMNILEKYLK